MPVSQGCQEKTQKTLQLFVSMLPSMQPRTGPRLLGSQCNGHPGVYLLMRVKVVGSGSCAARKRPTVSPACFGRFCLARHKTYFVFTILTHFGLQAAHSIKSRY